MTSNVRMRVYTGVVIAFVLTEVGPPVLAQTLSAPNQLAATRPFAPVFGVQSRMRVWLTTSDDHLVVAWRDLGNIWYWSDFGVPPATLANLSGVSYEIGSDHHERVWGVGVGVAHGSAATGAAPTTGAAASRDLREIECDGVDQDGDGADLCNPDADGDGVRPPLDCDDADPRVSPREMEVACDGVDQNCDGLDDCDRDRDGVLDRDDCDPADPSVRLECRAAPTGEPVWMH